MPFTSSADRLGRCPALALAVFTGAGLTGAELTGAGLAAGAELRRITGGPESSEPELDAEAGEATVGALAESSGFVRCRRGRSGSEPEPEEDAPPPPGCDDEFAAMAADFSSAVPFLFIVIVLEK